MKEKKTNCKYCLKEMDAKTTRREFCSNKCKVYWHREKNTFLTPNSSVTDLSTGEIVKNTTAYVTTLLELKKQEPPDKSDIQNQIDKLTAEMNTFGNGQLGERMKNATRKKIENLKKLLK